MGNKFVDSRQIKINYDEKIAIASVMGDKNNLS